MLQTQRVLETCTYENGYTGQFFTGPTGQKGFLETGLETTCLSLSTKVLPR